MNATAQPARAVLLWDLPTRAVHWLLALLVPFSWWAAAYHHLPLHRLSGYAIVGLLLFRLLWGFLGHQSARFAAFLRPPAAVIAHLRGRAGAHFGHSPLGGWSVAAMLGALAVQAGLGLFSVDEDGLEGGPLSRFVSFDAGRAIAHVHHLVFWLVAGLIGLHLIAIAVYEIRGARLVAPMVTGRAPLPVGLAPPRPARLASFCLCAAAALAGAWFIAHGLRLGWAKAP